MLACWPLAGAALSSNPSRRKDFGVGLKWLWTVLSPLSHSPPMSYSCTPGCKNLLHTRSPPQALLPAFEHAGPDIPDMLAKRKDFARGAA